MQMTGNVAGCLRYSCDVSNEIISVERIKEYSELEMEVTINRENRNA